MSGVQGRVLKIRHGAGLWRAREQKKGHASNPLGVSAF
ncbi:hypothetical protein BSU04_06305 [Caballeronia sordidicola]|uniref:Uncharacterized protein n=1 Tax=Caballeronia sordidicola TaxID=196367 RepID=A0A226X968_CABSO|nr:hypothetical protein BSU04_06305 [Caballeronia sordidicola]